MTGSMLSFLIGDFAILAAVSWFLMRQLQREEHLLARLRMIHRGRGAAEEEVASAVYGMVRVVGRVGDGIARSGLLSTRTMEELRQTLLVAGFKGSNGVGVFVGTKLLLMAGLPLLVALVPRLTGWQPPYLAAQLAVASGIGMLAPDYVVRSRRKRYVAALERGVPDALDMLVICSQAGLGLEASIERVGVEIRHAHRAIADELVQTGREMRVNADSRAALLNLGTRTGLESLRRLGALLVQSMQYGTPLSQALRALSAEQRHETLVRFEGQAARLPVLLTLPMIVFILPCVFLVVAGPAVVQVLKTMHP
ncbi:MAG: type II secretion system F family protein [Rhodospirillales bacterium]|nr:type II secretion system F family protein [Rhodospirillales bacterium]